MSQLNTSPYRGARSSDPTDCHHSKQAFDTLFRIVAARLDISSDAKLVHGAHVSMHRLGKSWTQAEIGATVGLRRTRVWDAQQELIRKGFLKSVRPGLGRPNTYELLGIPAEDLDRKSPASRSRTDRHTGAGQTGTGQHHSLRKEEMTKNDEYKRPLEAGQCFGCGQPHKTADCPTYGHLMRT